MTSSDSEEDEDLNGAPPDSSPPASKRARRDDSGEEVVEGIAEEIRLQPAGIQAQDAVMAMHQPPPPKPSAEESYLKYKVAQKLTGSFKLTASLVKDCAKNKLFRAIKFLTGDDTSIYSPTAKFVCRSLGVGNPKVLPENDKEARKFWDEFAVVVRKAVDSKRASTGQAMQEVVCSKFCFAMELCSCCSHTYFICFE